ncbi:hypothetical protein PT974_01080 [Cladobotryum mycophilum]|uniref:Sulphur transport domain-containing protein n=1 Tax=Cladobotryum mycophilum TaxID=491253 RepID=A0ABR0T2M9_9HYPO
MASFLSGAAFGAAMMSAGFHQPSIVISQMKFENWHMFQAFLAATASSAIFYAIAERVGYVKLSPRSSSPLGLFARYDGNIIGGALLGTGMALSGSCPGTLYAQLAAGVQTGFHALNGAILGGIIWTGFLSTLVRKSRERAGAKPVTITANEQLGVSRGTVLLLFEAVCLSIVAITTIYTPRYPGTKVLGAIGGLIIGLSQLFSLVTRRAMLGTSGSYEEFGNYFWWVVKGAGRSTQPQSYQSLMFAVGVSAGAWGLLQVVPSLVSGPIFEVSPLLATTGGVLMAIGSRMAGGCTSGHGVSGMSLLSVSSVITIASAFGMGAITAPFVH